MSLSTYISPCIILITTLWLWHLSRQSWLLALALILCTLALQLGLSHSRRTHHLIFLTLFAAILSWQWLTTPSRLKDLATRDTPAIVKQQQRLTEYPSITIQFLQLNYHLPIVQLFELRRETIILSNLTRNFAQLLDLNYYFFASHPRETVGIPNIEKFPFIFLPFFIIGLLKFPYSQITKTQKLTFIISFILPIFIISLKGHSNPLGPFSLIPFFTIVIVQGLGFILPIKFHA